LQPQNHQFWAQVVGLIIRSIFLVSSIVQRSSILIQRRLEPVFCHIESYLWQDQNPEKAFQVREVFMSLGKTFSVKKNPSAEIEQYSEMIYPSKECHIALCLIPPDNQPVEHRFAKVGDIGKFLPYCRFRNANRWNIYITPSILK